MLPKILYVITQGGPWGGAQKYVYYLATALASSWDVTVAVGEPKGAQDLQKRLKEQGTRSKEQAAPMFDRDGPTLEIIQLQHLRRAISPWHDLMAIFELRKLYKQIQPDIVHLNSSKAGVLGALAAIGLTRRPSGASLQVIYTAHGWAFTEPIGWLKRGLYVIAEWATARLKAGVIVLSQSDRRLAQSLLGIRQKKLHFIPLGIEQAIRLQQSNSSKHPKSEVQSPKSTFIRLPRRTGAYSIVCIANFFPNKGVDILIRAFAEAFPHDPNIHLTLVGDGPERQRLEQMVTSYKLQTRIHLLGFRPDAAAMLPDFDLFVLPSRKEGLPYALLEAITAGIPVIATDVGDVSNHIINKTTGLLVPSENVAALTDALHYAKEHPDEMSTMSEAGLERIRQAPTTEAMCEATTSLYRSLVLAAKSS